MWIVSQNKTISINMNKILSIYRNGNSICSEYPFEDACVSLAKYKTEERAKEVLQEITKAYTGWENFKYGIAEGIGNPKYEMPQE